MNWMVKHNKLDEHQLNVLDAIRKGKTTRFWVRGYAGTGKSVLLVHALVEHLAANPDASACVVVFTHTLKDLLESGIPSHLGKVPVMTFLAFCKNPSRYNLILVDEVQDLPPDVLQTLKMNSDKLIVAGDEEQSIYQGQGVSVTQIEEILSPSTFSLDVLYRITGRLRNVVRSILPDSRIHAAKMGGQAVNVDVALAVATDEEQEIDWVWQKARDYAQPGEPVAILLPNKKAIRTFIAHVCAKEGCPLDSFPEDAWNKPDFHPVNQHMGGHGLALQYTGNGFGSLADSKSRPLVFLMTYHSAKGLDFETVFLPFLDAHVRFWRGDDRLDRTLFFVACTRSRRNLFLSHHTTTPHPYVQAIPGDQLTRITCQSMDRKSNQPARVF